MFTSSNSDQVVHADSIIKLTEKMLNTINKYVS